MAEETAIGRERIIRIAAGGADQSRARAIADDLRERVTDAEVLVVGSTGAHDLEPLILATREGKTAYLPAGTSDRPDAVATVMDGDAPATREWSISSDSTTDGPTAVVAHDADARAVPTPEAGPLSVGDRAVLGACGWVVPTSVADYRAAVGGEEGDVLAGREDSGEAIDVVRDRGLLGRGRGDAATDEPIAACWETASQAAGEPVVVVNANEADPRSSADRLLCESAPLGVLDGALAASRAIEARGERSEHLDANGEERPVSGASQVVVYLNETDTLARERLEDAAAAFTTEFNIETSVSVVAGPDTFMAGETTAAIEAIEGADRLEARLRPPQPSEHGLDGRPTVVHTPRTLVQVRAALGDSSGDADTGGASASDDTGGASASHDTAGARGTSSDPGTRLFTVGGDVATRTTVELSTDDDLAAITDGVGIDGTLKAACVGGVFGGVTETLDVPARANALAGAGLGTSGAIEVFDDRRCMVTIAGRRAHFAETENCGRCVPCREGTAQLTDLLRQVYDGSYEDDLLRELARVMSETSICSFGQSAARPVRTAMAAFEPEFRAHAEGRCPSGACE